MLKNAKIYFHINIGSYEWPFDEKYIGAVWNCLVSVFVVWRHAEALFSSQCEGSTHTVDVELFLFYAHNYIILLILLNFYTLITIIECVGGHYVSRQRGTKRWWFSPKWEAPTWRGFMSSSNCFIKLLIIQWYNN
jgi:hypothetical protein